MVVALLGGSAIVLLVALMVFATSWTPQYDDDDPRYHFLTQQITSIAERWSKGDFGNNSVNLTLLNDGRWKAACILGGYNSALDELEKLGATVSEANKARLVELRENGFRISEVEEFEMMIVFVDSANEGRFIHFESGLGPDGQHLKKCTYRSNPKLELT
ncbi:hypothetical protein PV773_08935 [Mesorhizobium sp. CC13]|uniref:hypothetical protein n=1 Tax=Mesorhizobium sp. CC13 TaxID=3029194 RepID=UPI00326609A8